MWLQFTLAVAAAGVLLIGVASTVTPVTKSGIRIWVDPATPNDRQVYKSSRGEEWHLVMSDEFNTPNRSFKPGDDHMWTSIDKPDGVNAALEVYSHNMTSTACDADGTCYFYIEAVDEVIPLRVWNDYQNPPGYKTVTFYYRAAMVQSWNKFCFQGGMVEVRAKLPGIVDAKSGNPDIAGGPSARAATTKFYPTWPGIWMMGNLGRAIFSASTSRMWPFSYDECNESVFKSTNQRISACDPNPGHGMNPNQGRGAPEIDILEGANAPDVPTSVYAAKRGHKSWYQNMKYAANNFCAPNGRLKQDYDTVRASLAKGLVENVCTLSTCSASRDPNANLSRMSTSTSALAANERWGINTNGTCFSFINGYTGAYLCSPGNPSSACEKTDVPQTDKISVFEYQMDALSANWPIHVAAYTDYLVYQLEWVMGPNGYVRWMLAGQPIYEIPASAITNPPQDAAKSNPVKVMIEEPMYLIFNVALSSTWGTKPPNPGKECRGDGKDDVTNKICDAFPLYMKIDYIRLYQDTSAGSTMQVGCDPKSHPTKQWIEDHQSDYEDGANKVQEVSGKAFCRSSADCTIAPPSFANRSTSIRTGSCVESRCVCGAGALWRGPRCTESLRASKGDSRRATRSFGPPRIVAVATAVAALLATIAVVAVAMSREQREAAAACRQVKGDEARTTEQ